jgi:type IV pilus assembly protein PilA
MKKGFTIVEIMIVVAIIVVLAGLAIPNLLRARLDANEKNAISNLQTISVASQTYWSVNNTLPTTLAQLHDEGYIDITLGGCGSSYCTKNGYTYYMGGSGLTTDFLVYTIPQTSKDGVRSFCSTSDGVTRASSSGATPGSMAACTAWGAL